MAEHPKTWIDVGYALATGLPVLAAAIMSLLGWLSSRKTIAKIDTNTQITKETNEKVNGRMDALISASQEAAHARGRTEGIMEQQHRQTMFAQEIIKRSTEKTNKMVRLMDAVSGVGPALDVLVVEDEEIDAIVLCRVIAKYNLRCETTATGQGAVTLLMQKSYGAIFADLDLNCPMSNRGQLIPNLMNNAPTTPLFVVTGLASKTVVEGMRLIGVVATIEKPATEENVGDVLNNLSNLGL